MVRLPLSILLLGLALNLMASDSDVPSTAAHPSGWLLVANKGAHALGIINPKQGQQVADVPEGGITGHEVAASPDGKTAFVPIYGNSGVGKPGTDGKKIAVIDLES